MCLIWSLFISESHFHLIHLKLISLAYFKEGHILCVFMYVWGFWQSDKINFKNNIMLPAFLEEYAFVWDDDFEKSFL